METAIALRRVGAHGQLACLLLPPLLTLLILFVAPISLMAVYGFWAIDENYMIQPSLQLTQYEKIAGDPLYLGTLASSAGMALLTTIGSLALALPLAYYIVRFVSPRWRVLLVLALIVPGWVSVLIRTYSWNLVIGEAGLMNWLLMSAGLIDEPIKLLFTKTSVVIGLIYIYLPYMLVPIYASIERLDNSVLEAAENLGADPFRRFLYVTLPLIAPGIVAGCVITFIPAVGEYVVPNMLGGLKGMMYGNLITTAFSNFDWPFGAALSMVLLASILACLLIVGRFLDVNRSMLGHE
ncbi:ABC transporter permease [Sinorhizobium fredii]|uniref:Probable ABC transporter, putrescine transport system permease protein n=1 Tax=Sinorhizobium fredii (strain HH103) TaxID=1117943 RepID=G9AGA3_SINF1|nr:ABC transporter permease [Sinorhizobium fredii]CCF00085.1 probable ABC transporter, putrescine transport system permease protein [Sinorhizobium fredii HH103]